MSKPPLPLRLPAGPGDGRLHGFFGEGIEGKDRLQLCQVILRPGSTINILLFKVYIRAVFQVFLVHIDFKSLKYHEITM